MGANLEIVKWESAPGNVLGFTTKRWGGVSIGAFAGLNLGVNTGDDIKNILKNYKMLEQYTNINNIVLANQVHGNLVLEVDKTNFGTIHLEDGDGFFTIEKNIALGVQTADCFPVLIAGDKGIAALHCGWRSLNSSVIENALKFFAKYDDIPKSAYIGPGICADHYEVREDMVEMLEKRYNPAETMTDMGGGSYKLDLKKLVQNALKVNGVNDVEICGYSSCHSEGFYSYRRENGVTGRMLSVIIRNSHDDC